MQTMTVTSAAFSAHAAIPSQYTCDGTNISPPLAWSGAPSGTQSFALIADDPDAPRGTWVHWVLYNLPASVTQLPENIPALRSLDNGARHGTNDFRKLGYGGPCPPSGSHRYFFKLYALDTQLSLEGGATKQQLLQAMEGHILAQGELIGTYQRR
ncbi:MAG TPA: YbhB/YbcL family Raf kinase inhibitor-like protein [Herpetosiphonaceae bacterium]